MGASLCGANLEIPPCAFLASNRAWLSRAGTLRGGQFDWGGRLLKCNGGARWWAQAGRTSAVECKGISPPDCERDSANRDESRP
jgi:hypothetical protein